MKVFLNIGCIAPVIRKLDFPLIVFLAGPLEGPVFSEWIMPVLPPLLKTGLFRVSTLHPLLFLW